MFHLGHFEQLGAASIFWESVAHGGWFSFWICVFTLHWESQAWTFQSAVAVAAGLWLLGLAPGTSSAGRGKPGRWAGTGLGQGLAPGPQDPQWCGRGGEFRGIQGGKGSESGSGSRGGVGPITEIFLRARPGSTYIISFHIILARSQLHGLNLIAREDGKCVHRKRKMKQIWWAYSVLCHSKLLNFLCFSLPLCRMGIIIIA